MAKSVALKETGGSRVHGWLNVWALDSHFTWDHVMRGSVPRPVWEPQFCILFQTEKRLMNCRTENVSVDELPSYDTHLVRLDGGKQEFDKRWGYETLDSIKEHTIQQFPFEWGKDRLFTSFSRKFGTFKSASTDNSNGRSQTLDSRNSKDGQEEGLGKRRGSVPVINTSPLSEDAPDNTSTQSRIASFFSRKSTKSTLKRTKSVTKLDRQRALNSDLDGSSHSPSSRPKFGSSLRRTMSLGRLAKRWTPRQKYGEEGNGSPHQSQLTNSRMRASRSHESLLVTSLTPETVDLSSDVVIKPLHSSILRQDYCFQIATKSGVKIYGCQNAMEQQKWVHSLRKSVMPNQDDGLRTENSLKFWVLEAKNCTTKKRYFCEVSLDKTLYARTSTKQNNEMLFWGELFEFNNLPPVDVITVNLFREAEKKKKKEKNILAAYVHIPVSDICGRQLTERWYAASSAIVGKAGKENKGELPLIRIRARYQVVNILPMDMYVPLIQYMQTDVYGLIEVLEQVISIKSKEEIASTMVHTLQKVGTAKEFLCDIVMAEVDKIDNENLTFRGNSIATKAMEAYMKLVGEKYIQSTLGDFIRVVMNASDDCEVDPTRVANNLTLQRHQKNLVTYCEMVWSRIIDSCCFFPKELHSVFSTLAQRCADRNRPDVAEHLVSSCVFLRFLCPAILSPSLFSLSQEFPQDKAARNLTLIAKTIQNLANLTKFGAKEEYMTFMNHFVDRELDKMKTFTKQISSVDTKITSQEFDGLIDLGKQLSILQTVLTESLEKVEEAEEVKLGQLKLILSKLTEYEQYAQSSSEELDSSNGVPPYDNVSQCSQTSSQNHSDPNANNNATNQLLSTLMKDYNDADLSKSQDLPVVPNQIPTPVRSRHQFQSLGRQGDRGTKPPYDDYVLFSPLQSKTVNHNVAQVSTMPRTERLNEQEVNISWNKIVTAAELVNGDYIDLISFMDDGHSDETHNTSTEEEGGVQHVSAGPTPFTEHRGYQSLTFTRKGYPKNRTNVPETNSLGRKPLSFANPLFQHQNHCQTQTVTSASGTGSLPRVRSFSSLGGDTGTHSLPDKKKAYLYTSQNGVMNRLVKTSSDQQMIRAGSCSSISSESLDVGGDDVRIYGSVDGHRRGVGHHYLPHSHSLDSKCNVAFGLSPGESDMNRPRRIGEFSKSAELSQLNRPTHQQIRRIATADTILSQTSGGGLEYDGRTYPQFHGRRGNSAAHHYRSERRDEKCKADYEAELTHLRQKLAETQAMLQETQQRLERQEEVSGSPMLERRRDPDEVVASATNELRPKDVQMTGIIQRLIKAEDELRQEQQQLHSVLAEKQTVIEHQEKRLTSLDMANARLMSALNQLKERSHKSNGAVGNNPYKLTLTEGGPFKTSSC